MADSILAAPRTLASAIERLAREDAVVLPFLDEAGAEGLLPIARSLAYRRARPLVGEGERVVYQDFDICMEIPASGELHTLMGLTGALLDDALALIEPPPLDHALALNDLVVQRYAAGSTGISPHRDHVRYEGIVALLPISGAGRFFVCADRTGTGAREVSSRPGDLILMRAPRLFGRADRPFHALCDVSAERYSIGMRQDATKVSRQPQSRSAR